MQSDWSRRVQYWPYCDLTLNIVLFDKKTAETTFGTKYSRMDQVKFMEDCLKQTISLQFFKGCLPQIYLVHS